MYSHAFDASQMRSFGEIISSIRSCARGSPGTPPGFVQDRHIGHGVSAAPSPVPLDTERKRVQIPAGWQVVLASEFQVCRAARRLRMLVAVGIVARAGTGVLAMLGGIPCIVRGVRRQKLGDSTARILSIFCLCLGLAAAVSSWSSFRPLLSLFL